MTTTDQLERTPPSTPRPKRLTDGGRPPGVAADRAFRWLALTAGLLVLVVLALIIVSMTNKALPWFRAEGLHAITQDNWIPSTNHFGAFGLLYGTLLVAFIALVLA